MAITTDQLRGILHAGGNVVGPNGKIGGIGEVFLDDDSGQPEWVTAKTGLFGTSASFVPLRDATLRGNDIVVQYDKDTVKDAPRVEAEGHLSPDEERQLYAHYGRADYDGQNGYDHTGTRGRYLDTEGTTDRVDGTVGRDTSGPTTDDAMTRSEERLRVGVQTREAGRARLRKFIVTENVTETVPVRHEEVRITREPITDANLGDALDGPAFSEEEHEVVLHEERPVVQKEAVPIERVRLATDTVTDQVTVTEEVRKEQIDTDIDTDIDTGVDTDLTRRNR